MTTPSPGSAAADVAGPYPVAWVVRAENGNVIFWDHARERVEGMAAKYGRPLEGLFPAPVADALARLAPAAADTVGLSVEGAGFDGSDLKRAVHGRALPIWGPDGQPVSTATPAPADGAELRESLARTIAESWGIVWQDCHPQQADGFRQQADALLAPGAPVGRLVAQVDLVRAWVDTWREVAEKHSVRIATLEAQLAETRKALEPFGRWARALEPKFSDHKDDIIAGGYGTDCLVTFGDLRRAAACLSEKDADDVR